MGWGGNGTSTHREASLLNVRFAVTTTALNTQIVCQDRHIMGIVHVLDNKLILLY